METKQFNHNGDNEVTENEVLAKAAELRKTTQLPATTASTHEIHGDIGHGHSR